MSKYSHETRTATKNRIKKSPKIQSSQRQEKKRLKPDFFSKCKKNRCETQKNAENL